MPPLETSDLRQYIVLWALEGYDDNGRPSVSDTPVQISARYESNLDEVIAPNNHPISSSAIIFVDRDIAVGSQIRLGRLSEITNPLDGLLEIATFSKIPDIKGRNYRREVTVIKKQN